MVQRTRCRGLRVPPSGRDRAVGDRCAALGRPLWTGLEEIQLDTLPAKALGSPVTGVGILPGTLRDQLGDSPMLLVFLRHFGCLFCREMVGELRRTAEANPDYPDVLFFFQGTATEGRAFLRRYWPAARAVADPGLEFYEMLGVRQASLMEALGPKVIASRKRARDGGYEGGARSGDIWRMPGLFAVQGERVLWQHDAAHAADHPDFEAIPGSVEAALAADGSRAAV